MRYDGSENDQLRPVKIIPGFLMHPAGSVLIQMGNTKVICTASVEEKTAAHLKGTGQGWVTAEYAMLPGSTATRKKRDSSRGKVDGRSTEIQRLIGRALRSVVDMEKMGELSLWIDCDVIQADGGTRTASITGAYVAMMLAFRRMKAMGMISEIPVRNAVAAVSVGIVDGQIRLDLPYEEDSRAEVDMNVVMTEAGELIEVQGTGEAHPFTRGQMDEMLALAEKGCMALYAVQRQALEAFEEGAPLEVEAPGSGEAKEKQEEESLTVVAATQNQHKLKEMRAIMEPFGMKVISQKEAGLENVDVEEDGKTFEENSYKKAREIMALSGRIAIADDSGLAVEALNGAPGVYSARFAGTDKDDDANNQKLLSLLEDEENRRAKFVSVVTMVYPDGRVLSARGECPGHLLRELRGDQGFGYDPMFVPEGFEETFGQLSSQVKNRISHRARALSRLEALLREEAGKER